MPRRDLVVVDDEFGVLYTIQAVLEDDFPDLVTFQNPLQAIGFIKNEGCRVVVTDLRMPEASGLDVLAGALEADADTQVILLTAHGSEKVAVEAMKTGAFYYITKPFDSEELRLVVRKALEQFEQRKKVKYDMEMANALQQNLLPQAPLSRDDLRISFRYLPGGGSVGGDYFDYQFLPDGSVGIMVADAMGHGVASAMLMAMLKVAFLNAAPRHSDPADLLAELNTQFFPLLNGRGYFSAFYAILHPYPRHMTWCSAAHPFPLLCRASNRTFEKIETRGMGVGMFPSPDFHSSEIELQQGDRILFYTDGLSDGGDTLMGRFEDLLATAPAYPEQPILDTGYQFLLDAKANLYDDVTLLLCEIL